MNRRTKRFIKNLFALILACACLFAATTVEAKSGYIYDSDGQPIQSSVGFVLNTNGVFNVNSTAWNGQINAAEINKFIRCLPIKFIDHDKMGASVTGLLTACAASNKRRDAVSSENWRQ